jgi:hypothetical protein
MMKNTVISPGHFPVRKFGHFRTLTAQLPTLSRSKKAGTNQKSPEKQVRILSTINTCRAHQYGWANRVVQ